ncbi:MAG: sel1 repeat family protein [Hyphomicrobiales bacterium]|nr:sel1 repeat family protein [Hyphomicrobiales bacterium]
MSLSRSAIITACALFFVFETPTAAQTDIEDILSVVDSCDLLAAHPDDPLRVAPGVSDGEMVPRLALKACKAALESSVDVARHAFQLGRAFLEIDDRGNAIKLFRRAADAGSAIALMYLGDAEQFGWQGDPNPDKALEYYTLARDLGMPTAQLSIDQVTLDPAIFTSGFMIDVLARNDAKTAAAYARKEFASAYLYAFALDLADECGAFLRPESVETLQNYRFPVGWSAAAEENDEELGLQDVLAGYDVEVLVDRHGCSGAVIESVATTFNEMLQRLARGE